MRGAASVTADRAALFFDAQPHGAGAGMCPPGAKNPPLQGDAARLKGMGRDL